MANKTKNATSNTTKTTKPKTTTSKSTNTEVKETKTIAPVNDTTKVLKQKTISIPLDYVIPVRSGVQGGLVYVSRKSGYIIQWENYGTVEYMTYDELVAMRNGNKTFFENNWVFFEDTEDFSAEEIYKALQVHQYYKVSIMADIDDILSLSPAELTSKIANLPKGIGDALVARARQLMLDESDIMDSQKKIKAIEEQFDVELLPKDI